MALRAPPAAVVTAALPQLRSFVLRLVNVAAPPGLQVTSWWRDRATNAAVGGHPESQHLFALALDLVAPDQRQLARQLRRVGLVAVEEGTHVHAQALPAGSLRRLGFFA